MPPALTSDTGYRVFKRAIWLGGGMAVKSAWPILLIVLPLIWEIVKAFLASRTATLTGHPDEVARAVRALTSDLPPEAWARRAWARAEWDVMEGRD